MTERFAARRIADKIVPIWRGIDWPRWSGSMVRRCWSILEWRLKIASRTDNVEEFVERLSVGLHASGENAPGVVEALSEADGALDIVRRYPRLVAACIRQIVLESRSLKETKS